MVSLTPLFDSIICQVSPTILRGSDLQTMQLQTFVFAGGPFFRQDCPVAYKASLFEGKMRIACYRAALKMMISSSNVLYCIASYYLSPNIFGLFTTEFGNQHSKPFN